MFKTKIAKIRFVIWSLALVAALFYFAYPLFNNQKIASQTKVASTQETPEIKPIDFSLTNQHGKVVNSKDWRGKYMLVYFGFSNCPDICPVDLANISGAVKLLGKKAEKLVPVFITIDPERDNVERLKEFASSFTPSLQALTGDKKEIDKIAESFKVYHSIDKSEGQYNVNHSGITYLLDEKGSFVTHFNHNDSPETISAKLGTML